MEGELALLLSVSKLIRLTHFWMNLSIAPFGVFTSDALGFFNAIAGEEELDLGMMLLSERRNV